MKLIKRLICKYYLHDYEFKSPLPMGFQKLECNRCGKSFAVNHKKKLMIPISEFRRYRVDILRMIFEQDNSEKKEQIH